MIGLNVQRVQRGEVDAGDFSNRVDDPDLVISDVFVVDKGTKEGGPAVIIRIKLPDGREMVAQTTGKLFMSAAQLLAAWYPDLL